MSTKILKRSQLFANTYTLKTSNGKDYLVVPGVIVQEQVMNDYYVPKEEIEFADIWNGTPITIRHPRLNNGSANVPEPDVAVIGRFYNSQWDEDGARVGGEYWIDISEAMQYQEGQYIINSIYANQVLETSTGYWASEEFSQGEFKGREYATIQHNLKPDHIAILVDEVGACSVADGCGVNRNSLLHALYTNVSVLNGGPGSGFWGHLGRPGQVGGAAGTGATPRAKSKASKRLKKGIKAYYVARKSEADKKSKSGFKTKTSLMSKAKAAALYNKMTKSGSEAEILEVNLKKGTAYESLSANNITVEKVPSSDINIITFETLQQRTQEAFTNAAECDCDDAKEVVNNEESISQKVEGIRKAFYEHSSGDSPYNYYIADYYENYLVVEGNGQLWKCTYTENNGEYTFQDVDDWTKLIPNPERYVEVNAELPASAYLVVEADGTKHLPVKDANGKPNHRLMGAAWAALHGGYRGNKYEGPKKSEAIAKLRALYKKEGMKTPTANVQNVTGNLPASGKKIWEKVYKDWLKKYPKDKEGASRRAWGAVKQAGWKKTARGTWVKSNTVVKGVETKDTRVLRKSNTPNWLVKNNLKKEFPMKISVRIKDALNALRKKGVSINAEDEIDEEEDLELEGIEDEDEDVEEELSTEKNSRQPQLTQNDVELVRRLGKVDWEAIGKLAEQAPVMLEMSKNAEAERDSRKKQLIAGIKTNAANPFSDEELNGLPLPVLTKMHNQYNVDYSGLGGQSIFTNMSGDEDEETLAVPSVVLNTEEE